MFGKLIDGDIQYFKPPMRTETEDIFTNDAELLLAHGWKEIVYTDPPEAPEGYVAVSHWEETETQIVQAWTFAEEEAEEADYLNALDELGVNTDEEEQT